MFISSRVPFSYLQAGSSLQQKVCQRFFKKLIDNFKEHANAVEQMPQLKQKLNKEYNPEYLSAEFQKYTLELGVPPINSYNSVHPKVIETDVFSQKMMFRIAAQTQFMAWMNQYDKLVDYMVASDKESINKICEGRLAQRINEFVEKVDKSSLKLAKIIPSENLDIMVYPEYQYHKTIEGVSMHRHLNMHASQYFKSETKEKLIYSKVEQKKQSKWAILNLKDPMADEGDDKSKEQLTLNQYLISFQTNIRLNLVRRADESSIVYGSSDLSFYSAHFFQIENIRSYSQDTNYLFTDIDGILSGNPFVSS